MSQNRRLHIKTRNNVKILEVLGRTLNPKNFQIQKRNELTDRGSIRSQM
ncbi:hypothetical protein LEP1GSC120_2311 [Leptospira santarosai str. 200702252]|nr:hypothetical protein LEP1GSC130_1404 [Leptospira santarosai str. 200403458]EMO98600.1 hypothetical protein LEP1GSC120_2311 [Leptospira santarosai str. 200702252]